MQLGPFCLFCNGVDIQQYDPRCSRQQVFCVAGLSQRIWPSSPPPPVFPVRSSMAAIGRQIDAGSRRIGVASCKAQPRPFTCCRVVNRKRNCVVRAQADGEVAAVLAWWLKIQINSYILVGLAALLLEPRAAADQ